MKIVDTSGSLMWRMRQRSEMSRATGQFAGDQTLRDRMRELHRITTTTRHPVVDGFYAEGRASLDRYRRGFMETQDFNEAYTSSLQNARMTDQEIEDLIERMNLSPR